MAAMRAGSAREHAKPGSLLLVVHDFVARSEDELSLAKGDRIELIERDDDFGDGWFLGRHMGSGNTGLFPEVYTAPAPKGTIQQSLISRRTSDGRQMSPNSDRSSITTNLQQRPNSSGIVPSSNASSYSQAGLRSSLPTTSTNASRAPPLNADSPVMHETLSVINEHITDLNGSRAAMNTEDARQSRSSIYSSQMINRFSYIPGHETDEDETHHHTEAEVMGWNPERVAEYLEDHGVEKMHCEVFKDQEISGEVLLAMDQSSLFIKEFQLGPVGRRLKTWHKIKALQDEVKSGGHPIERIRSGSQYSDGSIDHVTEKARNRSSTIGTILPRALDTPASRQLHEAGRGASAVSVVGQTANRLSTSSASAQPVTSTGRPDSSYRPSAHSIRTMNSRRHSSVDSTPENFTRSTHRKQPSMDSTWQPAQNVRPGHRHLPSADTVTDTALREALQLGAQGQNDVDRGYFSSTEMERRTKSKRTGLLRKSPPGTGSPDGGRTSQSSSIQNTPISATLAEPSPASASTTSIHNWSSTMHSFSSRIGTFRSVTTPLSKPMIKAQDTSSPVVTKLDSHKSSETAESSKTTSPVSAGFGFFGSQRIKMLGLRATSDAVTKDERSTAVPPNGRSSVTAKEEIIGSPTRTGSTTPSTETQSFDLQKSDIHSRASTGSGSKLALPPPSSRRARHKTKKATSAYTKGLEIKSPVDAMADCDYSGWMKKKSGSLMTTWKTRLFILKGRRLSYYYRDDDTEEKGLIDISFHRVLPAHHETLTGVHAAVTGAIRSAPSLKEMPSKTAAQRDLEERPRAVGEDESTFIFKLVPPKAGLSKGVNFTKPTVHYFAVNSRQEGRLWMAALMKATIDRDDDAAVTTTYNQKTISLAKARARRERPPALREDSLTTPAQIADNDEQEDRGLGIGGLSSQEKDLPATPETIARHPPKTFVFEDEASSITPSTVDRPETVDGESLAEASVVEGESNLTT